LIDETKVIKDSASLTLKLQIAITTTPNELAQALSSAEIRPLWEPQLVRAKSLDSKSLQLSYNSLPSVKVDYEFSSIKSNSMIQLDDLNPDIRFYITEIVENSDKNLDTRFYEIVEVLSTASQQPSLIVTCYSNNKTGKEARTLAHALSSLKLYLESKDASMSSGCILKAMTPIVPPIRNATQQESEWLAKMAPVVYAPSRHYYKAPEELNQVDLESDFSVSNVNEEGEVK
jgi:hypothetical protein